MINQYVIPDVHGCIKTLKFLLETRINLTKHDDIIFLGDYIDRGPDSKGVIDYIMNLQNNRYNVHCIKGNHEYICVQSWMADHKRFILQKIFSPLGLFQSPSSIEKKWRANGGNATLESFGVVRPHDIEKRYIEWMKNTKYYIELKDYVLVHAGLNFNIENPFIDTESMISVRDFCVNRNKISNKRVINGHTPTELSHIKLCIQSDAYDSLFLDNGVHMKKKNGYGNLLAYNLKSKELIIQPNID